MRQHAKQAHLSRYAGWKYYLKNEPIICIYNNSKNFIYSWTIFHHVSVATTTVVREVHLCEPKHRCCRLPICLIMHTQIHFVSPTQGASQQAVCWWGHKVNLHVHKTAYNSSVLVHRGGLPWRWLCPPLKHAGMYFDCTRNFLNCYMRILLGLFLDNNFKDIYSTSNMAKRWNVSYDAWKWLNFPRKVEPGGLLRIPTPQHQNKEQPTSTGPNIREYYNYNTITITVKPEFLMLKRNVSP